MKLNKEELEKGKAYDVVHENGSKAQLYWDGNIFDVWLGSSYVIYRYEDLTEIHPVQESKDTLQEVVGNIKGDNQLLFWADGSGEIIDIDGEIVFDFKTITELLTHIRKPQYEEGAVYHVNYSWYCKYLDGKFRHGNGDAFIYKIETAVKVG